MARITLRDYNNEINDLIDHRQIDEAISHCRHILQTYPKHVDTYRLLGKAYLEEQRYGDAADILQRVLSSIPDDFISQIGMSIIREDEMNLDAAIYHMELAFESQPSNHAIQDELRRLFAKRDGIEPPRIRLTRGALARMYAYGHLHEQAISELQTALSEDPKRYDLQTLLADMLFQADKKVEAAETCTKILEKLPFNLDANRLLATILKESSRDEDAERFQKRWEALDPYAAFVQDNIRKTEQVSDDAVTIEREDWEPSFGDMPDTGDPAWASSLGVSLGEDETKEDVPDWLSGSEEELPAPEPSPLLDSSDGDWMTADASSTDSPFGEINDQSSNEWMAEFSSEPAQEPTAEGKDWLSEISGEEEKPEPPTQDSEEIPDFMKDAGWGESTGEDEPGSFFDQPDAPAEPTTTDEMPDWMKEMAPKEDTEAATPAPDLGALADIQAEADPDWEKAIQKDTGEPKPEWLSELGEQAEELPAEEEKAAGYLAGEFGEDDTDDWLSSLSQEQPTSPPEETPVEEEKAAGYLAGEFGEDDTDDWLASLPQEQPDSPLEEAPEEEKAAGYLAGEFGEDDTDDWLASLSEAEPELPDEEPLASGVSPEESLSEDSGTDDWLASLSEPEKPPLEEAETKEETAMDWLTSFGEEGEAAAPGPETEEPLATLTPKPQAEDEPDDFAAIFGSETVSPEAPEPFSADEPADGLEDQEAEELDWLASMAAGEQQVVSPDEPLSIDDQSTPDWLSPTEEDEPSLEPSKTEATQGEPDFADLFGEPETPSEETASAAEGAVLEDEDDFSMDWLDSISQEAAAEAGAEAEALGESETEPAMEGEISALSEEAPQVPTAEEEDSALDWLQQLGKEETDGEPDTAQPPSPVSDDLSDLFGADEPIPEATPSQVEPVLADEDDFSMDWLDSISQEAAEEAGAEPEAVLESSPEISEAGEPASLSETDDPTEDDFSSLFGDEPQPTDPVETQPQETAKTPSFEEEGLAWLESLAAKQGVAEEELVTTPDERTTYADDRTPDWLKEIEEDQPAAEPSTEPAAEPTALDDLDDLDSLLEEVEAAVEAQVEDETAAVRDDEDDPSMEWLDIISQEAAAEASPDEPLIEPPLKEDEPQEEEALPFEEIASLEAEEAPPATSYPIEDETPKDDTTPDWLKIIEGEDPAIPPSEPATPVTDLTEESETGEVPAEPTSEPVAEVESETRDVLEDEDDFSMDWLETISQEAAAEAGAVADEETPTEAAGMPAVEEETPEWLATIEEETEEELAIEEIPDMEAIFGVGEQQEAPAAEEDEPVQPEETAPPRPTETEAPEAEPSIPQDKPTMVPEWLQEIADEKPSPEPVTEPEWLPEVDEPEPQSEIEPSAEEEWQPEAEASAPTAPVKEEPEAAPVVPQTDDVTEAKRSVQSGDLESAIKQFNAIIKKGKLVEEAIVEIKEALRRHPVNVELWQVLGDAYMKENNLQEALDAYSKAENLLR